MPAPPSAAAVRLASRAPRVPTHPGGRLPLRAFLVAFAGAFVSARAVADEPASSLAAAPVVAPDDLAPTDAPVDWPAWATTPELRELAAPVRLLGYGDTSDLVSATTPDAPSGPTVDDLRVWAAAAPAYGPTDCPLEMYRLVATARRSVTVVAPDGRQLEVRVGEDLGGGGRTWGWVPRQRLVAVRPGPAGAVGTAVLAPLDGFPEDPRRRVWAAQAPAPAPEHPAYRRPLAYAEFDRRVADEHLDAPPPADLLAALASVDRSRLAHVAVACSGEDGHCLVRGDAVGLSSVVERLRRAGYVEEVQLEERFELRALPTLPCQQDDVVRLLAFLLEARPQAAPARRE